MRGFGNIRRVQKYIKSQALSHNVPIVPNYSLDQALSALIDLVVERATQRLQREGGRSAGPTLSALEANA
jgi:2-phosphoglycerate kinase